MESCLQHLDRHITSEEFIQHIAQGGVLCVLRPLSMNCIYLLDLSHTQYIPDNVRQRLAVSFRVRALPLTAFAH